MLLKKETTYIDRNGNTLKVLDVVPYTNGTDIIYYESDNKEGGLINSIGRYFLSGSIYANELKPL